MYENMNVRVTCGKCNAVVYKDKDVSCMLPLECEEHECAPSPHDIRAQFGAGDVEQLAVAIYNAFHSEPCPCGAIDPWELYGREKDDVVVIAFRQAAKEVAAKFADGAIGGMYYGRG